MFGLKDVFTTINVLGGAFAIFFCVNGEPFLGGVAVMLGWLLGDAIDGFVARKLNSANQFGAEYDTIADHLAHVVAPAAIVYTTYAQAPLMASELGNKLLGAALGSAIIIASSVRHARNIVRPVDYKGVWSGLPRTGLGFLVIGLCLSETVRHFPQALWAGIAIIPALCVLTLTRLPFVNHHIRRAFQGWALLMVSSLFVALIASMLFYPRILFDLLFIGMSLYTLGFVILRPEERTEYRQAVAKAMAESQ
jgi:CDP-diacylglycerol--serine O-phosphatidyltransferase